MSTRLLSVLMAVVVLNVTSVLSAPKASSKVAAVGVQEKMALQIDRAASRLKMTGGFVEGQSGETGTLTAWFKGNSPRKISAVYYPEKQSVTMDFYFNERGCFMMRQTVKIPDNPNKTAAKVDTLYFSNGRLLRWVSGGKVQSMSAADVRQSQKEVLGEARRLTKMAHEILRHSELQPDEE